MLTCKLQLKEKVITLTLIIKMVFVQEKFKELFEMIQRLTKNDPAWLGLIDELLSRDLGEDR